MLHIWFIIGEYQKRSNRIYPIQLPLLYTTNFDLANNFGILSRYFFAKIAQNYAPCANTVFLSASNFQFPSSIRTKTTNNVFIFQLKQKFVQGFFEIFSKPLVKSKVLSYNAYAMKENNSAKARRRQVETK